VLAFAGEDRKRFLHGMLSADVLALSPGRGCWTCVLTPKGKLVSRFALYELDDRLLAVCEAGAAPATAAALGKALPLSRTKLLDETREWSAFHLLGPGAREAARAFSPGASDEAFVIAPARWAGAAGWSASYPAVEPSQRLLLAPREHAGAWAEELARRFARPALPGEALEALRVEAGFAAGKDFDDAYPLELGMEPALSFTKGCYMGQETAAMMKGRGHVNRRLAGLASDGPIPRGASVVRGGQECGRAGGGADSPALGRRLTLALLRTEDSQAGTRVEAGGVPAEVVAVPLG